jgi:hypothetical protein
MTILLTDVEKKFIIHKYKSMGLPIKKARLKLDELLKNLKGGRNK